MSKLTRMITRHCTYRIVLAPIIGLLLGGCVDFIGPSAADTYWLDKVDGKSPRIVISEDDEEKVEILSGSLILREDSTITYSLTGRNSDKVEGSFEDLTVTENGTYTQSGSSIVASFDDGSHKIDMSFSTDNRYVVITFAEPDGSAMRFVRSRSRFGSMGVRG